MPVDKNTIRVAELFAGVGGFRLGLEGKKPAQVKRSPYKVVWSNQWEPTTKVQHASQVYVSRFGSEGHSDKDIAEVPTQEIPEHDLLVGGFPCQDYSVARTLSQAHGLVGKKGVLWWQIHRILEEKKSKAPRYLMLENVDRLLKSPSSQRGRDFAIMLASLSDLGYLVEWRVINAADYGMPQRRRRVYIMAYRKGSEVYKEFMANKDVNDWLTKSGVTAKAFSIEKPEIREFVLEGNLEDITNKFIPCKNGVTPFGEGGFVHNRRVYTFKPRPRLSKRSRVVKLGDIIQDHAEVPQEYFIDGKDKKTWEYLKGPKREKRKTKDGFQYEYTEGGMIFPDRLDAPSRTIVTGEGGITPSRFKHVIETGDGRWRRLTPMELERLNMFPDNHTAGVSDTKRAFFMGNALIVGVIERLGTELARRLI